MLLVDRLKKGEIEIDCLRTGRKAELVIVKKNEPKDAFICTKCALEICHTKEYSQEDFLPIDEFFERIEKGILQIRSKSINHKLIGAAFEILEDKLTDRYATCLEHTVGRIQDEVIGTIEEPQQIGLPQPISYAVKQDTNPEDDLSMLIRFYRQVHNQSDQVLLSQLELLKNFTPKMDYQAASFDNLVQMELNKVIQPVKNVLALAPPISEETETINRFNSLSSDLVHFSANMNHSVSFLVGKSVWFYGFSQVAAEPDGAGIELEYFLSTGRNRSKHNQILHHRQSIQTQSEKLQRPTRLQIQGSFAVLFKTPILLAPQTWYNLSMSLPEDSVGVFRSFKGLCPSNQFQTLVCKSKSGAEMSFTRGKDDNTNMSVFNGYLCDFFISKPTS